MNKNNELTKEQFDGKAALSYVLTGLAVLLCYILFAIVFKTPEDMIKKYMLAGILVCAAFLIYQILGKQKKADRIIMAIIIAGIIMRIGYMLYTPYMLRGHDIGNMNDYGHLTYIFKIYRTWNLPNTNEWQYYHPPFQHFVEAVVVKAFSLLKMKVPTIVLFEAAKIVPCFASCSVILVCKKIIEELQLSKRTAIIAIAVIAFQPTFYFKAADINNDTLMLLFYMIAILYTIRWYYRTSMKNILMIAVSIGLAMMTKVSGFTVAFFTGTVFLIVLIKKIREKNFIGLLGQYSAFAAVCAPLGLWHPIRNLIKFGQPLGYVFDLGKESILYCGDHSIVARFLSFPLDQIFNRLYCHLIDDYNIWTFTLKCSVFGEYTFIQNPNLAKALLVINFILIVISLVSMIYVMLRGKKTNVFARFGLFFLWAIQLIFFIIFNIKYPQVCTMDFRYIIPTAIVGACYTGIALSDLKEKGKPISKILYFIACIVVALFAIASILFYTTIK